MGEKRHEQQGGNRWRFTEEFKRDAVGLVGGTGRPIAQIAGELGSYDSTLGDWVRQDRIDRGEREGLSSDERARLREGEAENARLRMARDLRKRTVAFWVTQTSTPCAATARGRYPEGRWLPGRRRLRRGLGVDLGGLRLAPHDHPGAATGCGAGGRAPRCDLHHPPRIGRDLPGRRG